MRRISSAFVAITVALMAQTGTGMLNAGDALAQDHWQRIDNMPVGMWKAGTIVLDN